MVILLNYTAILCTVHFTRMFIYIGYWTLNNILLLLYLTSNHQGSGIKLWYRWRDLPIKLCLLLRCHLICVFFCVLNLPNYVSWYLPGSMVFLAVLFRARFVSFFENIFIFRNSLVYSIILSFYMSDRIHIHISTQHGFIKRHSTITALHNINTTIAKGFKTPHARTLTVTVDMSKAFDTVNIHKLTRTLLHTHIPNTIIKFIACIIFREHPSIQRQFKTGVSQGILSSTFFNLYTLDIPQLPAPVNSLHTQMTLPWYLHTPAKHRQSIRTTIFTTNAHHSHQHLQNVTHVQINNTTLPMNTRPTY